MLQYINMEVYWQSHTKRKTVLVLQIINRSVSFQTMKHLNKFDCASG